MFRWTLKNIDTGDIYKLAKDPKGWQDLKLTHYRGQKFHGVHYNALSALGFFCKGGGKEFIDTAYEAKGQEAHVTIKLEVKCNGAFNVIYTGRLNYSTYRQEYKSKVLYSYVETVNNDLRALINNREDLEVDLLSALSLREVPLNTYPFLGYDIGLHSKTIRIESEWTLEAHGACFRFITPSLKEVYLTPSAPLIKGDFEKSISLEPSAGFDNIFNGFNEGAQAAVNTSENVIFVQPNTVTVTWDISGQITFTSFDLSPKPDNCADTCGTMTQTQKLYDQVTGVLRLYYGTLSDQLSEAPQCADEPITNLENLYFIDIATFPGFAATANPMVRTLSNLGAGSAQITMHPGDKLWFGWVINMNWHEQGDLRVALEYTTAKINIVSDTVAPANKCKSIAIHEAWSRLSEIITDQKLAFYSEFFGRTDSNISYPADGCGSRVAITSGKNIRRLPDSPPIKVSLSKMFAACDAIWGVGMGIESYKGLDVLRVEELEYFYQNTEILKLDFVPNIQMEHAGEMVYNEIKLGFEKWRTSNVNGLDEPLTKINYVVPEITQNKVKFEKISPFVAGMYAIEVTRRTQDVKTKDTDYDEDIFILALSDTDLTACERDEGMTAITGLIAPETAYNLRFLLSSTFDRLKNQFTAGLTKIGTLLNPILMPAEAEGNESVVYAYKANGCAGDHKGTQQGNGDAGRYPDANARRDEPLFLPEIYTFDYPLPYSEYLDLISNPYGLIRFSYSDSDYLAGWLLELEYNLHRKSGAFKVIRGNPNRTTAQRTGTPVTHGDFNDDFNDDFSND